MKEYTFSISAEHRFKNLSGSKTTSSEIISITSKNKRLSTVSKEVREEFIKSMERMGFECICILSFNLIGIEEVNESDIKYR